MIIATIGVRAVFATANTFRHSRSTSSSCCWRFSSCFSGVRFGSKTAVLLLLQAVVLSNIITNEVSAMTILHQVTKQSLRQRLLAGEKSYGPMIMSDSPIITELLATVGYDHIIIDHEHSPTDVRSGQSLLQALDAAQSTTQPIVRLPSPFDITYMKKVLDTMKLPGGVLIPMIDSVEIANSIVQSTRYPPSKHQHPELEPPIDHKEDTIYRGCAVPFIRSNQYGIHTTSQDYVKKSLEELLVMVQIETIQAIEIIPQLADIYWIDAMFIGPFDLSASIGKMGQFNDPEVQELIAYAEDSVRKSGCLLAGFKPPHRSLQSMFHNDGYSLICGTVDIGMLRDTALIDFKAGYDAIKGSNGS